MGGLPEEFQNGNSAELNLLSGIMRNMKKIAKNILVVSAVTCSLVFISCGNGETKKEEQTLPPAEIKKDSAQAQASAYICPMNCENGKSDKPGKCPDCEMDMVEKKQVNH